MERAGGAAGLAGCGKFLGLAGHAAAGAGLWEGLGVLWCIACAPPARREGQRADARRPVQTQDRAPAAPLHACALRAARAHQSLAPFPRRQALGADFLVHYGHSCLVPVGVTRLPCMYVFVDIKMDLPHFLATVR